MTKPDSFWPDREDVRYSIRFQHIGKGDTRPSEIEVPEIYAKDKADFALAPNVGDYVRYTNRTGGGDHVEGRVRTRYFHYQRASEQLGYVYCVLNIVIEDVDDPSIWGQLNKD